MRCSGIYKTLLMFPTQKKNTSLILTGQTNVWKYLYYCDLSFLVKPIKLFIHKVNFFFPMCLPTCVCVCAFVCKCVCVCVCLSQLFTVLLVPISLSQTCSVRKRSQTLKKKIFFFSFLRCQ